MSNMAQPALISDREYYKVQEILHTVTKTPQTQEHVP